MTGVSLVKLPSDECHWIFQTINQYWFRWWLGAVKQQVSAWANVDPDLCRHMASLGYNDLTHSGPAHENTYHVCDKQALTNKDICVYEMWVFIRYLLFSYCPLLRQNIDVFFFFFFFFFFFCGVGVGWGWGWGGGGGGWGWGGGGGGWGWGVGVGVSW